MREEPTLDSTTSVIRFTFAVFDQTTCCVVQCLKPVRYAVKVARPLPSVLQPGVPLLRVSCRFLNVHIELLISFLDMLM
jgi:hypothetical protein